MFNRVMMSVGTAYLCCGAFPFPMFVVDPATMVRTPLVVFALVVATLHAGVGADAQWGVGGMSTFQDISAITSKTLDPLEPIENVMKRDLVSEEDDEDNSRGKDVLDEIRGLDEPIPEGGDETLGRDGSARGSSKKAADEAARHEQDYMVQWMPSARPGFVVPEIFRRQLTADMMEGMDDVDMEEQERDRARKTMPKSAPGKAEEAKGIDKCLRQVSKYCSFKSMSKDFATFSTCCFDMRHHVKQGCFEWCENHGRCAPDMRAHCPGLAPSDTTECLLRAHAARKLSRDCTDSPNFKSMEEGADDMREKNRAAQEASKPTRHASSDKGKDSEGEVDVDAGIPTEDEEESDVEVTVKSANYGSGDEL